MQLSHYKTIREPAELVDGRFQRVTSADFSPDHLKLAVASVDRYITLYDDADEQRDRFQTRPREKETGADYKISAICFSPESDKLAVGQSDNIVFVYRLGEGWGAKKSICNKFATSSSVTCMCWPSARTNEVVFGLADGRVKVGILKMGAQRKNKSATLFQAESCAVRVTPCMHDGHSILSSHMDGTLYRYTFPDPNGQFGCSKACLGKIPFVANALCWGQSIVAAGNTSEIFILDEHGNETQRFDCRDDPQLREFTCGRMNPSGQTAALGSFDALLILSYSVRKSRWEKASVIHVPNLCSVTALAFRHDGARLATGSLAGAVDLFDACLRRVKYKGKFEFTYTSLSSVIIKRLRSGERLVLKSHYGSEITKISVQQDRYVVAHTAESLILGDLETAKLSEVPWNGSGKEKYFFDCTGVCMVQNAGELSIIEYGVNEVLGTCHTEFMSTHMRSVRVVTGKKRMDDSKVIAYLLDLQTVRVQDLVSGQTLADISHDTKIDWLELNCLATQLLFLDSRRSLHLYDVESQQHTTLLEFCNYCNWVPDSDVVIAQNRGVLCVWYNIHNPKNATIVPIKGEVEEIERTADKTEVIVDEGVSKVHYALDQSLIEFGTAVHAGELEEAVNILESLQEMTPESRSMWERLSKLALEHGIFSIAQRCFTALGDVAKGEYLAEVARLAALHGGRDYGRKSGQSWIVTAKMAILNRQYKRAETLYIQQGRLDQAILMYIQLHKWDDAMSLAKMRNHPKLDQLRAKYFEYLLTMGQEDKAAREKEQMGDYEAAIDLYLKGGCPAKAAGLAAESGITGQTARIAEALVAAQMHEEAGDFYHRMDMTDRAMAAYRRGHCYRAALELARRSAPQQVVRLEEEWGDHLLRQGQPGQATTHFIEAGCYKKAIATAIKGKSFQKAAQILDHMDAAEASPYFKQIAEHFASVGKYDEAQGFYTRGGLNRECVDMLMKAGRYDKASQVARTYMGGSDMNQMYSRQAQDLEIKGDLDGAAKLYLEVNEPDLAIAMYKKAQKYDKMIQLVAQHRKEHLAETHVHLGTQFEAAGDIKLAEQHFTKGGQWKRAAQMYSGADLWDDALRVARTYGGTLAYKQMAYSYAMAVGGDVGVKFLTKRGLGETAVEYAVENNEFTQAFQIAEKSCRQKLPDVHYHYAMHLEDNGRFAKAEEQFISASRPKEAVDMYIHQQDWDNGMRVARDHHGPSINRVYEEQGNAALEMNNYVRAEGLFVQADKSELAIEMWRNLNRWDDAIRVAKQHRPALLPELQKMQRGATSYGSTGVEAFGAASGTHAGPSGMTPSEPVTLGFPIAESPEPEPRSGRPQPAVQPTGFDRPMSGRHSARSHTQIERSKSDPESSITRNSQWEMDLGFDD